MVTGICVEYRTDYHTVHNARSERCSLIVKLKQDIWISRLPVWTLWRCFKQRGQNLNLTWQIEEKETRIAISFHTGSRDFRDLFQFRNESPTVIASAAYCVIVGLIFDANQPNKTRFENLSFYYRGVITIAKLKNMVSLWHGVTRSCQWAQDSTASSSQILLACIAVEVPVTFCLWTS